MKKNTLHLFCALCCLISFGQSTIYHEDFTGQTGKGALGPGDDNPSIDLSGVNWSIDVSNVNLTEANDYFAVIDVGGNELLEGRDLDFNATWLSPVIDISNYTDVAFSITVTESNGTGGNNLEPSDTVLIEYRLDSDTWITASINGILSDDYDLTVSSASGLLGSTLELRVTMTNNGGGERQRIDAIEVTGTSDCTVAYSLPFNEGFEGGVFPPECWQSFRGSNNLGTVNDWTTSTLLANSGTTSAFVEYEVVTGGNAQDWLVTPAIDLGTAETQLQFFAREQFTLDWNTEYSIRVSQTSPTDISSFTTIETYNEAELGATFNKKTIDLSNYSGIIYIAFVMEQNDGDNWFLDDISVVELAPCTIPDEVTNVSANYDGTAINLNWALGTCYDDILVVAKEGSAVTSTPTGDGSAYSPDTIFGNGTAITTDEFVVLNSISSSVAVSNVSLGNTYHFEIFTRKGSSWSSGVPVSIAIDYCAVTGDTSFDTSITLVDFGSINNVTAQGSGYDNFTNQSTSIARGESEDLTVNLNTDGNFAVYSYAWIDWNRDGDFDDAGETYDLGEAINTPDGPTSNSALTINVPLDAALGDTRMRILCQYYFSNVPTNGPCDGSTDGEIEDYTVTILPGITYTYNNGWSPSDPNGVATLANPILVEAGNAIFNSNTNAQSITVGPGASVTVNSGVDLNVFNTLTLESTSTSYSSLILDGIISGTVEYKRHVNSAAGAGTTSTANDLISAPLVGQNFGDFRATNPNILSGTIGGNTAFLFGPFDTSTGSYINFTPSNDTNTMGAGIGYRTGSTNNSTFTFTGNVETTTVNVPVISNGSSDWNLIGNPYPSYINVQAFLNNMANSGLIDENAVGIYGYDGAATDGWTIYNLATTTASTVIAPGQGFFINAESSGTIEFTSMMRSTGVDDDFIAGRNSSTLTYLKLQLSSSTALYKTDFYFNPEASTGLDIGYDASVWNSHPANFSIHSYLVEGANDTAMSVQALHSNDLNNVIIPLGITINPNEPVTFSILESTLPEGINVYLEDAVSGSVTLLNNNNYEVILDTSVVDKGRFYIRFVNQVLSSDESALEQLGLFVNQEQRSLAIKGQLHTASELKLYDIQGRLLIQQQLKAHLSSQYIDLSDLPSGVFIVSIESANTSKTQKIVLK